MPYSSAKELPEAIRKKYGPKQLRAFISAFNSAKAQGRSEEAAFRIAHAAAQNIKEAKAGRKREKSHEEWEAELRAYYGAPVVREVARAEAPPTAPPEVDVTRAFLLDVEGRTILTAPAALGLESAATPNEMFLWLQGAFVGADQPNRNGALWTTADLEMGQPTVKHGPLNWLHQGRRIIGAIAEARLVEPTAEQADAGSRPFIAAASAVWRWLWPDEARVIEQANDARQLWYSMECVSREVACIDHGCGSYPYLEAVVQKAETVCEHVRLKQGTRRFVDPTFLGGAVIVPPVRPGWPEANLELIRQAASHAEVAFQQAGEPDYLSSSDFEKLVAKVLEYASA